MVRELNLERGRVSEINFESKLKMNCLNMNVSRWAPGAAVARLPGRKSFAPGLAAPKRAITRRASSASLTVKAFKENSQLQDWRVKDMVQVCAHLLHSKIDDANCNLA